MPQRFPSQRLVVTGAGSGLGRSMALRFAKAGWRVAVTDLDTDSAAKTLELVQEAGGDGFSAGCDVRHPAELEAVVRQLDQQWSGVDVAVNNAGVGSGGTVVDTPLEHWEWTLDTNLMGVVHGCRAFAPLLQRQRQGHIVNIASFAGIANAPSMAAYNVAKAGVISLSESLRVELHQYDVGVSVVCPAFFKTNIMTRFRSEDARLQQVASKLVDSSPVSATDVSDDIYAAVHADRFMVITHTDARWLYRLKRLAPETFNKLLRRRSGALLGEPGEREQ